MALCQEIDEASQSNYTTAAVVALLIALILVALENQEVQRAPWLLIEVLVREIWGLKLADYPAMSFFLYVDNSTNKNPNANKLSWVIN